MNRKRKTREVVTYLLATVAGDFLLPVFAPAIVWTNVRGYGDKFSSMPGVQSQSEFASVLPVFVYVAVFVVLLGRVASLISSGGIVLGYPSSGVGGEGLVAGSKSDPTLPLTEVPTLLPLNTIARLQTPTKRLKNYD